MKYLSKSFLGQTTRHIATRDLLALAASADPGSEDARVLLARAQNANEEQTKQQKDLVVDQYIWFAKRHKVDPWAGSPSIIASWLQVASKRHVRQTISQRASIVQEAFERRGLPSPLHAPLVVETLSALLSEAPARRRTHEILVTKDYRAIKATIRESSLLTNRDSILLGFGFVLMLRPDSILRLTGRDVSVRDGILSVRSTYKKQPLIQRIVSQEGDGLVEAVRDYLEDAQIDDGPLFPGIENGRIVNRDKAIVKARLDRMYKDRLVMAGFPANRYCWTSLRYGFLWSGHQSNVSEVEMVKRAGFDTVGHLRRVLADLQSGSGGFCLPSPDARRPAPMLDLLMSEVSLH